MREKYMSEDDAREFISSMDGDAIVREDIVDEDSGEVYLEAGDEFNKSPWNPDHRIDKRRSERDKKYAERAGVPQYCEFCDRELKPGKECPCGGDEDPIGDEGTQFEISQSEFENALKEFSSMWEDYTLDQPDVDPQDAAPDAADGFFDEFPEWKTWSRVLGQDRRTMKEIVTDHVYDAMTKGKAEKMESRRVKKTSFLFEVKGSQQSTPIPKTFEEFRLTMAKKLKDAGAPQELVDEVEDVDYEGPGVAQDLYAAWGSIEYEMRDPEVVREIDAEGFARFFESDIYNAVVSMVDSHNAEQRRSGVGKSKKIDDVELAQKVVEDWEKSHVRPSSRSAEKVSISKDLAKDVADKIAESLRVEGSKGIRVSKTRDNSCKISIDEPNAEIFTIADFLTDELQSNGAKREYGLNFERDGNDLVAQLDDGSEIVVFLSHMIEYDEATIDVDFNPA